MWSEVSGLWSFFNSSSAHFLLSSDWIVASIDIKEQLSSLQSRGHKKQYLEIARSLPCYGCVQFSHATVDYPLPNSPALVIIGNKELSLRTLSGKKIQETKFKVTRMRCWRVTTIHSVSGKQKNKLRNRK
jgi:sorting nexin-17